MKTPRHPKSFVIFVLKAFLLVGILWLASGAYTHAADLDMGKGRAGDILYIHHPPDPVNVRNGNFYLPVQDYFQPCFGFPLEVYRSYNSVSTREGPFGYGWTFNYDLQIIVGKSKGVQVIEADGFVNEYEPVDADENIDEQIQKIIEAKKKEDRKYTGKKEGKGDKHYQDLEKRLRKDESFRRRQRERYIPDFNQFSKSGKYVSNKRGKTFLDVNDKGFIRSTETGRKEIYNEHGLLSRIEDRNGNYLKLNYDSRSRLKMVEDSCGQWLKLDYNGKSKIEKIVDSMSREMAYQYDGSGRLTESKGLDGQSTKFRYDAKNRMTAIIFADGARTDIEYDKESGRVTKQSGPGKKVTQYKYGRDKSITWAEVSDNLGTKNRYEYNDPENQIIFKDSDGNMTVTTVSECCGKPLSILDKNGKGERFKYDDEGNLIEKIDATGKRTKFEYEPKFSLVSEITNPDGSKLTYRYDKEGNLIFAKTGENEHVKLVYEKHGKIETIVDQKDHFIRFEYTRFGKPSLIEKKVAGKKVGTIKVSYDRLGNIQQVEYEPQSPEVAQSVKSTLAGFLRILKPSGIDFEI